jgi:hypothetical protein
MQSNYSPPTSPNLDLDGMLAGSVDIAAVLKK